MGDIVLVDSVLNVPVYKGDDLSIEVTVVTPRHLFRALNKGTSAASAPTWPTPLESTVVDNDITWINVRPYEAADQGVIDPWLASRKYSERAQVLTPLSALDLTGYTGAAQIRDEPGGALVAAGAIAFAADRTTGVLTASWTAAQTALFTFTEAAYDIEITSGSGVVTTVCRGTLGLVEDVTA